MNKAVDENLLFNLYVIFAPEPTDEEINFQLEHDRMLNLHNDNYKLPRRSVLEIRADFKIKFAKILMERLHLES